jgi:hypothetical protein
MNDYEYWQMLAILSKYDEASSARMLVHLQPTNPEYPDELDG